MKRRIFSILSALSLVLCVLAAVLWVGTATRLIGQLFSPADRRVAGIGLAIYRQGIEVSRLILLPPQPEPRVPEQPAEGLAWLQQHGAVLGEWLGVQIGKVPAVSRPPAPGSHDVVIGTLRYLRMPYWLLILTTGILPFAYFVRAGLLRRQQRLARSKGLCRQCGYDLRASKERCPECGTAITAEQVAQGTGMEKKDV